MNFDPYHRWLGIPKSKQPADCYRLLGLDRFEDDLEVIRDAAERQITHVRGYAKSEHREAAANILNELARAELTLTDPKRRSDYDAQLRQETSANTEPVVSHQRAVVPNGAASDLEPLETLEPVAERSNCPKCGGAFLLRANQLGKILQCAKCKHQFVGGSVQAVGSQLRSNSVPSAETVFESESDGEDLRLQSLSVYEPPVGGYPASVRPARPAATPPRLVPGYGKPGQFPNARPFASAGSAAQRWSTQTKLVGIVVAGAASLVLLVGLVIAAVMFARKSTQEEVAGKDSLSSRGAIHTVAQPKIPELNPIPKQTAQEGMLFELSVKFVDVSVDPQLYSFSLAKDAPKGVSIERGQIIWTPDESQGGAEYTVGVIVTHSQHADWQRTTSVPIVVSEVNTPPEFVDAPARFELKEGVEWKCPLHAKDDDEPAQKLRYNIVNPDEFPGITIDQSTGEIIWISPAMKSDSHRLHVQADDGLANADHEIEIRFSIGSPAMLSSPFTTTEARPARDAWATAKGVDAEFTNSIGMKFNLIPPGKFKMGSPRSEADRSDDEFQHEVEISKPFFIGVYEVTQQEYEKVVGENPAFYSSKGRGKEYVAGMDTRQFPVESVSWDDAQAFIKALNAKERGSGRRYRLPSEAEWEYACRAGSETPFSFGSRLSGDNANCDGRRPYGTTTEGKYLDRTARVGSYSANAFGLYDMHGNVYEWCQDYYKGDYYKNSPLVDPSGLDTGSSRVIRGGSWDYYAVRCRSAYRRSSSPSFRYYYNGFRVVCELE